MAVELDQLDAAHAVVELTYLVRDALVVGVQQPGQVRCENGEASEPRYAASGTVTAAASGADSSLTSSFHNRNAPFDDRLQRIHPSAGAPSLIASSNSSLRFSRVPSPPIFTVTRYS